MYEIKVENTTQLTELNLSSIHQSNYITIKNNENLSSIRFDSMNKIFGHISITENKSLKTFDFPKSEKITTVYIARNKNLIECNFSNLKISNSIKIEDNPNLTSCVFPKLEAISNFSRQDSVNYAHSNPNYILIRSNKVLTSVEFPLLKETTRIETNCNENLTEIKMSELIKFNRLDIGIGGYCYNAGSREKISSETVVSWLKKWTVLNPPLKNSNISISTEIKQEHRKKCRDM